MRKVITAVVVIIISIALIFLFYENNEVNIYEWLNINYLFIYPNNNVEKLLEEFVRLLVKYRVSFLKVFLLKNNLGYLLAVDPVDSQKILYTNSYNPRLGLAVELVPGTSFEPNKTFYKISNKCLSLACGENWDSLRRINERVLEIDKPNSLLNIIYKSVNNKNIKARLNVEFFKRVAFGVVYGHDTKYNKLPYKLYDSTSSGGTSSTASPKGGTPGGASSGTDTSFRTSNRVDKILDSYNNFVYSLLLCQKPEGLVGRFLDSDHKQVGNETVKDQLFPWFYYTFETLRIVVPNFLNEVFYQRRSSSLCENIKNEININELEYLLRSKNTHLHWAIIETLRLYNPVTIISRKLKSMESGCPYRRYSPEIVILFPRLLMSKRLFKKPEVFNPERWSRVEGLENFPFSFGLRTCPGRNVSLILIKIVIVKLLKELL